MRDSPSKRCTAPSVFPVPAQHLGGKKTEEGHYSVHSMTNRAIGLVGVCGLGWPAVSVADTSAYRQRTSDNSDSGYEPYQRLAHPLDLRRHLSCWHAPAYLRLNHRSSRRGLPVATACVCVGMCVYVHTDNVTYIYILCTI